MKQILKLIFILVIVIGIFTTSARSQTRSYTNQNYEIKFPNTWKIDTSKNKGTEFFICIKSEIKSQIKSQIISLIVQNLVGQNIDIIKYKQITERQIADLGNNGKIFNSEIKQSKKGKYFRMEYSFIQDNRKFRGIQLCFLKNKKSYLLTFTSDLNKFEQYKNIGENILNSFNVKN